MFNRVRASGLVTLLALVLLAVPATAQTVFEQRLMGPAGARFFTPVAIDGNRAVVGAPWEMVGDERRGAAYVFVRSESGTWSQVQRLVPSDTVDAREFGFAVAMQGNRLVVTARGRENNGYYGAAYVFTASGTSFVETGSLSYDNGADGFGTSVALDGNTILVGAPFVNAAYAYTLNGGAWTRSTLAVPADSSYFGTSVAVAGNTACVGSPNDRVGTTNAQGRASIYTRSGATWTLAQTVVATDGGTADNFGNECAVSGNTVVVGADLHDAPLSNQGAAYVYVASGANWTFQRKLTAITPAAGDRFGSSLALVGDTLIVGAATGVPSPARGQAYLFRRSGTTWTQVQTIDTADGGINGGFGESVAHDGNRVIIGAGRWTTDPGYAHILRLPQTAAGVPGPPANFQTSVSGNSVSMTWAAPTSGGAATDYTVIARTVTGQLLTTLRVGNALSLVVTAPNGIYQVSVVAQNALGLGLESAPRSVTVPTATPPPGAPVGLTVAVSGNSAGFTWSPPAAGGAVSGYLLLAGATPGFVTPIATLPLPAAPASTTIGAIPSGNYWVRVVARNGTGNGPPSNKVNVVVAPPAPPAAPSMNAASVVGRTVTLSWTANGGGTPLSFLVVAAASPGGAVIASVPVAGTSTSVTVPNVPRGTYYVRIAASNRAGTSGASNEVVVVVP